MCMVNINRESLSECVKYLYPKILNLLGPQRSFTIIENDEDLRSSKSVKHILSYLGDNPFINVLSDHLEDFSHANETVISIYTIFVSLR